MWKREEGRKEGDEAMVVEREQVVSTSRRLASQPPSLNTVIMLIRHLRSKSCPTVNDTTKTTSVPYELQLATQLLVIGNALTAKAYTLSRMVVAHDTLQHARSSDLENRKQTRARRMITKIHIRLQACPPPCLIIWRSKGNG